MKIPSPGHAREVGFAARIQIVRTSRRVPPPRRKETAGPGYVVPIALAERVVGCKELLLPSSPDLGDEDPQEEGDDEGDVQEQQGDRSVEQEERGVHRMANPRIRTVRHKLVVGPNFEFRDHEPSERPDALTPEKPASEPDGDRRNLNDFSSRKCEVERRSVDPRRSDCAENQESERNEAEESPGLPREDTGRTRGSDGLRSLLDS